LRTGSLRSDNSMTLSQTTALSAILASVVCVVTIGTQPSSDSPLNDVDHSVRPGDDFYRYANGGWAATAPAGQSTFDTRSILTKRTSERVTNIVHEAAAGNSAEGGIAQKVGAYYASFMDEPGIEAKGLRPLAHEMAAIGAVTNRASLSAYLGTTLNSEVDGLTSNADHIFGVWINQGFEDAEHNFPHILQGGLGMPDRDAYIDSSPKMVELRSQYQSHIAAVLKLAGIEDADTRAVRVMSLESRIAQAHAPDADAADVSKQNNLWKRDDFSRKAPGMNWEEYFKATGLAQQLDFLVWQPSAVTGVSALVGGEDIEVWKDYLRLHLIEQYASVLPKEVAAEHFNFFGKTLSGAQQVQDRDSSAIAATNGALGQAISQLYTRRYFPPEAKAKAQAMAVDLISAYRTRISNLKWMSASTKAKALAKLAALEIGIGYPDAWIDYSSLEVVRGDAFGNMRRAEAFNRSRNLAKLKQGVDPIEWPINPHVPGAVIMFSPNAEFFSAAILQPPYFDIQGDPAFNYGSAGAGMAHEISHSFDELGNIYDDKGRLANWWTAEDKSRFDAEAARLVAQFNRYCPLPDLCLNGKQVQTENVADLAGLVVAHDAYLLSVKGKADVVIGGLTGEQRFFLAFAQRWRRIQSEDSLRRQVKTDTHPPGQYRSDTVRNVGDWYRAYQITPADKLFLKAEDRVEMW
jgi:putative endopeptidase